MEIKNKNLRLKLSENVDNIYSMKYYYEGIFSLEELKNTHKFFVFFDKSFSSSFSAESFLKLNLLKIDDLEDVFSSSASS